MKGAFALALTILTSLSSQAGQRPQSRHSAWWVHVEALANDGMEGRSTGSPAHKRAAEYVAEQFRKAGLEPAGIGGYIQPVKFQTRRIVESESSLSLVRDGAVEPLVLGEDANISMRADPAPEVEAPLVFAGYGLRIPESGIDDLDGLNLAGAIVVYIAATPKSLPGPLQAHFGSAAERWKAYKAAGAIGTIGIANPRTSDIPWERSTLARLQPSMSLADASLEDTQGQQLVLSAHLDHLGIGEPINGDRIYNGAMDNASGVAAVLEVAARLRKSGTKPARSILFLTVTGEEKGELGSRYFAAHPTVPRGSIVADVNTDMLLPLFPLKILMVLGLNESDLGQDIRASARELGLEVQADPEPQRNRFVRSDQYSFIKVGIPALSMKVGYRENTPEAAVAAKWTAERYHAPSDDLNQPVDVSAADKYIDTILNLSVRIANRKDKPKWNDTSFFKRFAGQS